MNTSLRSIIDRALSSGPPEPHYNDSEPSYDLDQSSEYVDDGTVKLAHALDFLSVNLDTIEGVEDIEELAHLQKTAFQAPPVTGTNMPPQVNMAPPPVNTGVTPPGNMGGVTRIQTAPVPGAGGPIRTGPNPAYTPLQGPSQLAQDATRPMTKEEKKKAKKQKKIDAKAQASAAEGGAKGGDKAAKGGLQKSLGKVWKSGWGGKALMVGAPTLAAAGLMKGGSYPYDPESVMLADRLGYNESQFYVMHKVAHLLDEDLNTILRRKAFEARGSILGSRVEDEEQY